MGYTVTPKLRFDTAGSGFDEGLFEAWKLDATDKLAIGDKGQGPEGISGCVLWMKADAITGLSDGDDIVNWVSSDNNGPFTFLPYGVSNKPTYQTNELNSKPIVRFDDSDTQVIYLIDTTISNSNTGTVFAVIKASSAVDIACYFSTGDRTVDDKFVSHFYYKPDSDHFITVTQRETDPTDGAYGNTALADATWYILTTQSDGSQYLMWVNGVAQSLTALGDNNGDWWGDTTQNYWEIGGRHENRNVVKNFGGDIAEIICYDTALSNTDRESIEEYLAKKYALSVQRSNPAFSVGKGLSDGVKAGDSISSLLNLMRSFTDGIKVGDSLSKAWTVVRALSDGIKIGDSLIKSIGKGLSDGVKIGDSLTRVVTFVKSLTDGVKIADSLAKTVGKGLSDGVKIADSLAKATGKVLSDGIKIADSLTKSVTKILADGVKVADSLAKAGTKALTDGVTISDSLSKVWTIAKSLTDGIKISDSLSKTWTIIKPLTDGIKIAEISVLAGLRHVPGGIWTGVEKVYNLLTGWAWDAISEATDAFHKISEKSSTWTKTDEKSTNYSKVDEKNSSWNKT